MDIATALVVLDRLSRPPTDDGLGSSLAIEHGSKRIGQKIEQHHSLNKNPNKPRNILTMSCTIVPETASTPCTLLKIVRKIPVKISRIDCSRLLIEDVMPVILSLLLNILGIAWWFCEAEGRAVLG